MGWSRRFAILGVALLVLAVAIPVLVPQNRQYNYDLTPLEDHYVEAERAETVQYADLASAERDLFDRLKRENGSVTLDGRVAGSHFWISTDAVNPTVVAHEGRQYVVDGLVDRPNFGYRYWGPPLCVAGFVLVELLAVLTYAWGWVRRRRRRGR